MRKCTWVELLRNPFLQVLSGFDKPLYCWLKVVLSNISVSFVMTGSTATVQRNLHCEIVEWDIERNPSEKDLQFKRLLWRGVWKNKKKTNKKQNDMLSYERKRTWQLYFNFIFVDTWCSWILEHGLFLLRRFLLLHFIVLSLLRM